MKSAELELSPARLPCPGTELGPIGDGGVASESIVLVEEGARSAGETTSKEFKLECLLVRP